MFYTAFGIVDSVSGVISQKCFPRHNRSNEGKQFTASHKFVNSFDAGPIFLDSLGQELSRNVFVVSVYAF